MDRNKNLREEEKVIRVSRLWLTTSGFDQDRARWYYITIGKTQNDLSIAATTKSHPLETVDSNGETWIFTQYTETLILLYLLKWVFAPNHVMVYIYMSAWTFRETPFCWLQCDCQCVSTRDSHVMIYLCRRICTCLSAEYQEYSFCVWTLPFEFSTCEGQKCLGRLSLWLCKLLLSEAKCSERAICSSDRLRTLKLSSHGHQTRGQVQRQCWPHRGKLGWMCFLLWYKDDITAPYNPIVDCQHRHSHRRCCTLTRFPFLWHSHTHTWIQVQTSSWH